MAKTKKMFGGGMSGMGAARGPMGAMASRMGGAGGMPTQSRMQAGARAVPAYARPYMDKMQSQAQAPKSGLTALDPAQFAAMQKAQAGSAPTPQMDKAAQDFMAQKSGATPAASQAAPMKKGGSVKETKKMFGGGMSSIVFQTIRESKALAYSTYSFLSREK